MIDFLKKRKLVSYAVAYADDIYIGRIIKWADVVIVSRNLSESESSLIHKAKQINKRVILDIDDYLFAKPSYSLQGEFSQDNIAKLQKVSHQIDCIVVASELLQNALMLHGLPSTIITTRANIQKIQPAVSKPRRPRYVYTTTDNIKLNSFKKQFLQMIQDFHAEYHDMKMVVYSDTIYDVIRFPFVEWYPRMHYKEYIHSLFRGNYLFSVVPLGGDEDSEDAMFHACKSPVKYFNYGLARIPGIYSDVPLYRSFITHEKTGILVKNNCNDWYEKMKILYNNAALRASISNNAYADICENHNIEKSAYEYYNVLKNIV